MRSAGTRRPTAASSSEELVIRLCGSTEATTSVLGARRAGSSTAPACAEHLVRLSRKSQEREGSCADQSNIEAHWLDWATSQKANPLKPTAAQSISGDEATENDSQEAEREGFEPSTEVASCNSLAGSRFQPLSHLSSGEPRVPSAGQVVRLQRGADVV